MHDASDSDLLRDYVRQNSEAAFAELVQRHIALVYSAALRHVGIAAHAEEITQAVFIVLARKAAGLRPDTVLEGWLYETTRLTALSFMRGERRRQFREQEAYMQSSLQEPTEAVTWSQLAPLLDEAMARLGKKDREAVVLRFFKDKNIRDVAMALQVNEAAAQRRVHRAVEKMRKFFTKRGLSSTATAITGTISANAIQTAPLALAKSVTAMAVVKGAVASGSIPVLVNGTMKMMTWAKIKFSLIGAFSLIATTAIVVIGSNFKKTEDAHPRAATLNEIQQLFSLATVARPRRCLFEADVESTTPPFTKAQIEKELANIKNLMLDVNERKNPQQYAAWEIVQSNAIVKAHSGKSVQHVREWYSGNYDRQDMNNEEAGVENFMRTHPNEYRDTIVDIPNSPFSQYTQYSVNRELRDVQLFKQIKFGTRNPLWQAFQMDPQVAVTFFISLVDPAEVRNLKPKDIFSKVKMDPAKAQQLHDQTDPTRRLEAFDEKLNGKNVTRFSFNRNIGGPGLVQVWVAQMAGKAVCLQEGVTNLTQHTATTFARESFRDDGFPTVWTITTVNADSTVETKRVTFKQIDMSPAFTDEEAFAPVFPPDYIVSDLSSGQSVILQNPDPIAWSKSAPAK